MNELHFIQSLQKGDETAYTQLVALYSDRVYNTALGLLQHAEDAEDVAQDVFVQVFQSIDGFKGDAKLSTWIYRITTTKSLEFIRKKAAKKRFGIFQSLFGLENKLQAANEPFYHPGVDIENKERSAILFSAIDKLPEKQKAAFILHKTEDLSYAEVAAVLETSVSAVESLLFRAKQNLQATLSKGQYRNA